jgi:hypothetical protein
MAMRNRAKAGGNALSVNRLCRQFKARLFKASLLKASLFKANQSGERLYWGRSLGFSADAQETSAAA